MDFSLLCFNDLHGDVCVHLKYSHKTPEGDISKSSNNGRQRNCGPVCHID